MGAGQQILIANVEGGAPPPPEEEGFAFWDNGGPVVQVLDGSFSYWADGQPEVGDAT